MLPRPKPDIKAELMSTRIPPTPHCCLAGAGAQAE